jgi:hypothetical protein
MKISRDKNANRIEEIKGNVKTVDDQLIIPPKFFNPSIEQNYFNPRFVHLVKGKEQLVKWINQDNCSHRLIFFEVHDSNFSVIFTSSVIPPRKSITLKFNFDSESRIDYYCYHHKNEFGAVIIFPEEKSRMSNTDQLRFLSKIFSITTPGILSHLAPK